MLTTCKRCPNQFEPKAWQVRKKDFLCLTCRRAQDAESRKRRKAAGKSISGARMPREYHAAYEAEYAERPGVRLKRTKSQKAYRQNPALRPRHEARWKVNRAIASGAMVRKPCEVCGNPKTQAHHDDYAKPLDVRWLCTKHHAEQHR